MLTNPRAERVRSVRALAKRSVRERTGRFVVEGPQGVRELVAHAPERAADVYLTPEALRRHEQDIVTPARDAGLWLHETTPEVLSAMADTQAPQGVLAVAEYAPHTLNEVLATGPRTLVLLTNVRDPGNAGTVIRGADAAGVDAVLVSESSVDVYSPKVVRSTAGSLFHLPVVTGLEILPTLQRLRADGIRTLAADGAGERSLPESDLSGRHCWVMGNEAWGLPGEILAACDTSVRVPIYGSAEWLNLAMAATVCLYASAFARDSDGASG